MDAENIQVGSTITNGSSAGRVIARVEKDPRWKSAGWTLMNIGMGPFDGNPGMTSFIPDYLAASWRHVPFEWMPVVGGGLEERYVWAPGWRWLQREVRTNFPRKLCAQTHEAGHEAGHEWQEKNIQTGNPLVEHSQWWRCE